MRSKKANVKIRRRIHVLQVVEKSGSSGWTRTNNRPVNRWKKKHQPPFCGGLLELAEWRFIRRRIRLFPTFALFRSLLPFAATCCTERARKGQRPTNAPPTRQSGPGEGQQPSQARQLWFVECGSEQVRRAFATRSTAGRFQGCVPTFRRAQLRERPTPPEATLSLLAFAIGQSINAQGDAKRAYFDARPHNDPTSAVKLLSH